MTALARSRTVAWHHPEWWVVPLVAASWLALVGTTLFRSAPGGAPQTGGYASLFVCPVLGPSTLAPDGRGAIVLAGLESVAMVVAMMGLLVLPTLHHVGLTSVWARRRRGPALVLAGFVATWLPVVWLMDLAVGSLAAVAGPLLAIGLAVAVAAAWQASSWKTRAVRRCGQLRPIPPRGWWADVGCLQLGAGVGRSCVTACAGFMLVAAAAGHGVVAMAALAAIQFDERTARRQRPLRGIVVTLAVGAATAASILAA